MAKKSKSIGYSYGGGYNYGGYGGGRSSGYGYGYGSSYSGGYDDDDGYGPSYGGGYSYNGGSRYSSFNWKSWGGFSYRTEDNSELFVSEHEQYSTPLSTDFQHRFYNTNVSSSKMNLDFTKELARFFFHKMIANKDYMEPEKLKIEEGQKGYDKLQEKLQFYDKLWEKDVPGFSPLEKAINLMKSLANKRDNNGQLTDLEDIKKQKMKEGMSEDEAEAYALSKMQEEAEGLEFKDEIYKDPVLNELFDDNLLNSNNYFSMDKSRILDFMSLFVDMGAEFEVQKETTTKVVPNSDIKDMMRMRSYSHMRYINMQERLMPFFNVKLATKNLMVRVPVKREESKQKIIILLDYSGSMNDRIKQEWVLAILIDRLRHASKENAEIYFSYFVHKTNQLSFKHIKDKKGALEFIRNFSTSPNGGQTDIQAMVNAVSKNVESGSFFNTGEDLSKERPEILIINDGQDRVSSQDFPYKTNAICLMEQNDGLRNLCINSGGKYVHVPYDVYKQGALLYSKGKKKH